ncbi:MAG: putative Ig domain-containing protein [Phycisphaerae bacterium]|nr:putative Ig domain-containing protein [Phycisphaerae bacterium]
MEEVSANLPQPSGTPNAESPPRESAPQRAAERGEGLPDLVITSLDTSALSGDWQSLAIEGNVEITVKNAGMASSVSCDVEVFEDQDFDGRVDIGIDRVLGSVEVPPTAPGESRLLAIGVRGAVLFRGSRLIAFVDPMGANSESSVLNNQLDTTRTCERPPVFGMLDPQLEWSWTRSSVPGFENSLNVMSTPAIIDLDGDGISEVIFGSTASTGGGSVEVGVLRALRGGSGEELFTITNPNYRVNTASSVAAGDLDADGLPEIVACDSSGARLICFENDGSFKWRTTSLEAINWGATALADLDADGSVEVVVGRQVVDGSSGVLRWTGSAGRGGQSGVGPLSSVSDIDLDGRLDVVAGNTVYNDDGTVKWQNSSVPDGLTAVGNFDNDAFGEIVHVRSGLIRLLDSDGMIIWGPTTIPGGGAGGPPTVADFDGDGNAEIGVATASRYVVFETDGILKWQSPTQDGSSNVTGSSVFDFEGDGAAEVVYRDELRLRIYRGTDGAILFSTPMSSCTWHEYVLVADVDGDGRAEIVAVANNNCGFGPQRGVYTFGSGSDSWVSTREVWNQHTYHITNVNDDGTVPRNEEPNWLTPPAKPFNSFRQNVLNTASPLAAPDATVSRLSISCDSLPNLVTARIGNGGALSIDAGLPVSFYGSDLTGAMRLVGVVRTQFPLRPGLFEDVSLYLPDAFDCAQPICVAADDPGTDGAEGRGAASGIVSECNEANNRHCASVLTVLDRLTDATLDVDIDYWDTTYNRDDKTLIVKARAKNIGGGCVDAPLVLVIDAMSDARAVPANADGFTPQGKPYFVFTSTDDEPARLSSGAVTPEKTLIFRTESERVDFSYTFQSRENAAPIITSFPATSAVVGTGYRYVVAAVDPDRQPLRFVKRMGPAALALNESTGEALWTPTEADLGSFSVAIEVSDDCGGVATQRFVIEVGEVPVNRPPVFTTDPLTRVSVGASYEYNAVAVDPDGDAVTYTLLTTQPAGMAVDSAGKVSWDFALPGDYSVSLRAADGRGGEATQTFVLTAGNVARNPHTPSLFGTPSAVAAVGQQYFYQPAADDADPGQTLVFTLPQAPAGMSIVAETGRITWTPTAQQLGQHRAEVKVSDGEGGSASQTWTIDVSQSLPNRPPVIDSIPNFIAQISVPYRYDVSAADPENQSLVYSLVAPPDGMTIDAETGLITWTPNIQAQTVVVAVKVTDPRGGFGSQVYDLFVSPPNSPPVIVSQPNTEVFVGENYRYDVNATDAERHPLFFQLLPDVPAGMTINATTGLVKWTPTREQIGPHAVKVQASDRYGGIDVQEFTIQVLVDTIAPSVQIAASPDPASINNLARICVQAGDRAGVVSRTLSIDGVPQTLDLSGCIEFTPSRVGNLQLEATATDAAGNVGRAARSLLVGDPNDPSAPTIELTSPVPADASLTVEASLPFELKATISDNPVTFLEWQVGLARGQQDAPLKIIGNGSGAVIDAPVATVDPTMLANDVYFVVIRATDGTHTRSETVLRVLVAGDLKLGNFQLDNSDLQLIVNGTVLTLARQYSTLESDTSGDFGHGWRLGFPGSVCDEAIETNAGSTIRVGSRIYVTRPDGRRIGFTVAATPINFLFSFIVAVKFVPDNGVADELHDPGVGLLFNIGGGLFSGLSTIYNPSAYTLRTKNGLSYVIDEQQGLKSFTDRNQNVIRIERNGIFRANDAIVSINRDTQGRITNIAQVVPGANSSSPPLQYRYDSLGNLVAFIDQNGALTQYHYEFSQKPHYLTRIEDPSGRVPIRSEYDSEGRLVAVVDASGHRREFDHDAISASEVVRDAYGNATQRFYDRDGNVVTLIDAEQQIWRQEYEDGLITAKIDPLGNRTEFFYDDQNNLVREVQPHPSGQSPDEYTTSYTYDARNNVTSISTPAGPRAILTYDTSGNLTSFRDGTGRNLVAYQYDARGLITTETNRFGSSTFDYDSNGQMVRAVESNGRTTTATYYPSGRLQSYAAPDSAAVLEYDAKGRQLAATYETGHSIRYAYGDESEWTCVEGQTIDRIERLSHENGQTAGWLRADGSTMMYQYDAAGRLEAVVDPRGNATSYEYDRVGRRTVTRSPRGGETRVGYDAAGRVTSRRDPEQNLTTIVPGECCGREASVTNPRGFTWYFSRSPTAAVVTDPLLRTTEIEFSQGGLPVRTRLPDGRTRSVTFDGDGELDDADERPLSVVDEGGGTRDYVYDSEGRLSSSAAPGGAVYALSHTPNGLASIVGPSGEYMAFEYAGDGNLSSESLSGVLTTRYAYNDRNLLQSKVHDGGERIDFDYDLVGREIRRVPSRGTSVAREYDPSGNLSHIIDGTGGTSFLYDADNRLSEVNRPLGARVLYQRDLNQRIVAIEVFAKENAAPFVTRYQYDPAGNLAQVTDPLGGVTTFSYDPANRLTSRRLPNGVETSFTYNLLDQVTGIVHRGPDLAVIASFVYERTDIGQPHRILREDGSQILLTYDSRRRLTSERYLRPDGSVEQEVEYSYDASDGRITKRVDGNVVSYRNEPGFRLSEVAANGGNTAINYDERGCQLLVARAVGDLELEYDLESHLIRVGSSGQATSVTYEYDGLDNRTGARSSQGSQRVFVVAPGIDERYQSPHVITDENGAALMSYVYAAQMPYMRIDDSGPVYYLTDAMGSVVGLTGNSGNIIGRINYDGFGNTRRTEGSGAELPVSVGGDFRFHGAWLESATKLYHMRARDYDPETGRFLTVDPAPIEPLRPETMHRYAYGNQNPYLFYDPSGTVSLVETSIKQIIRQAARDQLFELGGSIATEFLETVMSLLLPDLPSFSFLPGQSGIEQGRLFEQLVTQVICGVFQGAGDFLWLEVPMNPASGKPFEDGFGCGGGRIELIRGSGRPDYLLSSERPTKLTPIIGGPKSFLVGDFKLSIQAMYRDWVPPRRKPAQFYSIANHARKFQFIPITISFALRGDNSVGQFRVARIVGTFLERRVVARIWHR